jgi:hypothetical protein
MKKEMAGYDVISGSYYCFGVKSNETTFVRMKTGKSGEKWWMGTP